MTSRVFFISDLHLGHSNILKFGSSNDPSKLLRPGFDNISQHDEYVISSINEVVRPEDKLIIVGDVVMNKNNMGQVNRINGTKYLVLGNHDPMDISYISPFFTRVYGAMYWNNFIVTHIPVHPSQVGPKKRFLGNIHGHLHDRVVMEANRPREDLRYFNVSVERVQHIPALGDTIIDIFNKRQRLSEHYD